MTKAKKPAKKAKLTRASALAEAERRWGSTAGIKISTCAMLRRKASKDELVCADHGPSCKGGKKVYQVGSVEMSMFFMIKGSGDSWELAFDDATKHGR